MPRVGLPIMRAGVFHFPIGSPICPELHGSPLGCGFLFPRKPRGSALGRVGSPGCPLFFTWKELDSDLQDHNRNRP